MERFEAMKQMIIEGIRKMYPHGYDVYADCDDVMDSASINKILKSDHPKDALKEWVVEAYLDRGCDVYIEIWNELKNVLTLSFEDKEYMDAHYDEYMEVIRDNLSINLPFSHFNGQEICANLVVDNGDAIKDFSYHDCYPNYASDNIHHNLSRKSGMMLIAHLQGYSTKKFRKIYNRYKVARNIGNRNAMEAIKKAYPFVASCYEEVEAATSSMTAFVICIKTRLDELLDFAEKKSDVFISRQVDCLGLCDFWSGAGGYLEVVLERHMVIPKENIFAFLPDDAWNHRIDGIYYGYGITEIFGMSERAWKMIG